MCTMKFRTKIKISFIVLAIIPIITMALIVSWIGSIQIRSLEQRYGLDNLGIESFTNPTKIYSKFTQSVCESLIEQLGSNPDKITDEEYLSELNKELESKFSFIVLKKNNRVIFDGGSGKYQDLIEKLPDYKQELDYSTEYIGNSYVYGDYRYLIKQMTFSFSNKDNGNIYIVTELERMVPQVKKMGLELIISGICVIFITGTLLTLWIYKSMMKPIRKLRDATNRIAEGDLEFQLEESSNDEFGELCNDFETMRKRLKESAEDKVKDEMESKELISNISHDLKTPITAIKGYVEGIMDGVADTPEKVEKYIKTIYNKANDMDRLIGELTVYSKIDTNRIPYNFEKVNVDQYFDDCVDEISIELESRNIQLNYFNYVDKSTLIIADVEQMKRVINNIISNSVKYIGNKQGAVNIRINDDNDFIHVEIEDNGKGIDTKDIPYIFDRFYRTDSSRNSNQGGSGIGLAIVKKIVEVHGGKIWATSKLDTGTIMHIIIRKYIEPDEKDEFS